MTVLGDLPVVLAEYRQALMDAGVPGDVANIAMLDAGRELVRHVDRPTATPAPTADDLHAAAEAKRAKRLAEVGS